MTVEELVDCVMFLLFFPLNLYLLILEKISGRTFEQLLKGLD